MRRDLGSWLLLASATAFAIAVACGANDLEAPRAQPRAAGDLQQCKGFAQLMPGFLNALAQGQTENLRKVIKDHLLVSDRVGEPPPINDTLRAVFTTLSSFAKKSPESGAPKGQLCAVTAPPLSQANELCEMRRALDLLVHQGKGVAALKILTPQVTGIVNYIIGKGKDGTAHYEIARVLAGQCAQDVECQLSDGLDLAIALSRHLETAEGKKLLADLDKFTQGGDAGSLLDIFKPDSLTENDLVGLSTVLFQAIQAGTPADLDALLNNALLAQYRVALKPIIDDLKIVLDPQHDPNLITPTRKVLNCITKKDPDSDMVRMIYRVGMGPNRLPELGVTKLVEAINGVRDVDQRGSLLHLLGTLATAVRADEQAIDSSAKVCRTLMSTDTNVVLRDGGVQAKSNAQLAMPVIADLLASGIVLEGICAIDTLIYGCAGGEQPACAP